MTISLAKELDAIASDFKGRSADVPVAEIIETGVFISALSSLAQRIELELSIFRDMEAGGQARRRMELAATEQLEDMIADAKGKIIRPDFGKGGRS
jgi:hypothetical protein